MLYHPTSDVATFPRLSYARTAAPPPETPALAGEERADVAIIGGGITGLSLALHAAEAGATVALLESNEIGWGSSGRNFGQVVPYLRHEAPHALIHFGTERGEHLIAETGKGPDLVFDLIERHTILCDANRSGLIFAAHTPAALDGLKCRSDFWSGRGVTLPILSRTETARLVGGGTYPGALLEPRGGTINPLAYTRGLARAAMGAGARIYTRSRATKLSRINTEWHIETSAGRVVAQNVGIATNAYTDALWPGLGRSLVPVRAYQLTSVPLSENIRRSILPEGHALTDTRRMTSGVRVLGDGCLHLTADGRRFGRLAVPHVPAADRRIARLYPQLGSIVWDYSWSGWLAMTPDEYPHLHQLAPGLVAALGYSGRGLALGTILGRDVARYFSGAPATSLALPFTQLKPVGLPVANEIAVKVVIAYKRLRDAIDLRSQP